MCRSNCGNVIVAGVHWKVGVRNRKCVYIHIYISKSEDRIYTVIAFHLKFWIIYRDVRIVDIVSLKCLRK